LRGKTAGDETSAFRIDRRPGGLGQLETAAIAVSRHLSRGFFRRHRRRRG
jgi:hypothetical protein